MVQLVVMKSNNSRKRGNGMKSYRVQYDHRTDEEITNWTYAGPPRFGPRTQRKGLVARIIGKIFVKGKHRNYPDGGFRNHQRQAA